MIIAFILFILLILVYIILADAFTIFFRLTGLTSEKARFQVISLLTNSGYTTQESEIVVNSKLRRKLAIATMLFGYAFNVTIVSAVINIFLSMNSSQVLSILVISPSVMAILIAFIFIRRNHSFKAKFDHLIEEVGRKIMFSNNTNPIVLVDDYGEMSVARVYLQTIPKFLDKVKLSESQLKQKYDILVMMIRDTDGNSTAANSDTILKPNDTVIVLGKEENIRAAFENLSMSQ